MDVHRPARPCGTGVLVLAGSSGRVDDRRAALLARHGALAAPLRWFGGAGQRPVVQALHTLAAQPPAQQGGLAPPPLGQSAGGGGGPGVRTAVHGR